MTRKHAGYYFAPLLMFVSATALGQVAYTPEQTQSDVSWIPWGIAIAVIAAGGFFLVNYFKNKGDSPRVSQPQMQPPKAASFSIRTRLSARKRVYVLPPRRQRRR